MLSSYFKFMVLPDDVKVRFKIRSTKRLDCTEFYSKDDYKGLTNFVNKEGQMFFTKTDCSQFIQSDRRRMADFCLLHNKLNLSSLYSDSVKNKSKFYGYPNGNKCLKGGSLNPLFPFKDDGYLFMVNESFTEIELLIVPNGRHLIGSYYQKFLDGGFDSEISDLKSKAVSFYDYSK